MATQKKALTFDIARSPLTPAETPKTENQQRQQVGARITKAAYRQIKARAALQGVTVQALVEQAITEFLANHPQEGAG